MPYSKIRINNNNERNWPSSTPLNMKDKDQNNVKKKRSRKKQRPCREKKKLKRKTIMNSLKAKRSYCFYEIRGKSLKQASRQTF